MTNQFKVTQQQARIEWLADLESDKFVQGKRKLHCNGKHCCLGVAIETFRRVEGREPKYVVGCMNSEDLTQYPEVQSWLGLSSPAGESDFGRIICGSLAELNDNSTNFSNVIRVIKSKPKGLFVTNREIQNED
jgi:hypothetical protein